MSIKSALSSKNAVETPKAGDTKNSVEPRPADIKSAEPQADPVPVEPVESVKAEPATAAAPPREPTKSGDTTIVSLSGVPEKLARQIRLLAKLEGKTISRIFLDAVATEIPARLKVALAAIVEE